MVKLINSYMTEADIANIARISTGRKSRADEELIRFLIQEGHDSCFEHAVMTFYVEVPIYTARQWMRHRIGSYTEKSGRYSEMESFDCSFHTADERRKGAPVMDDALYTVEETFDLYQTMISGGVKKEVGFHSS